MAETIKEVSVRYVVENKGKLRGSVIIDQGSTIYRAPVFARPDLSVALGQFQVGHRSEGGLVVHVEGPRLTYEEIPGGTACLPTILELIEGGETAELAVQY